MKLTGAIYLVAVILMPASFLMLLIAGIDFLGIWWGTHSEAHLERKLIGSGIWLVLFVGSACTVRYGYRRKWYRSEDEEWPETE